MKWSYVGPLTSLIIVLILYLIVYPKNPLLFLYLTIFSLAGGLISLLIGIYKYHKEITEMEERFPEFLSALAESLRSGMTLVQAFEHVSKMNLGKLSKYIESMYYKMTWGIPFPKILKEFADSVPSKEIKRASIILLESYITGGEITDTLESLSESLKRLREIRKDIQVILGEQVKVIYSVNILFMVILAVIYYVIVPIPMGMKGEAFGITMQVDLGMYKQLFLLYAVSIAISSGLIIGVVSEGRVSASAKHIIFLLVINLTIIGVVFFRKVVNIEMEFPENLEVGKEYLIKGSIFVEGKGCDGELTIPELNKSVPIISGDFETNVIFNKTGTYRLTFLFRCNSDIFTREVTVNVR